jgi:hypothetical protein
VRGDSEEKKPVGDKILILIFFFEKGWQELFLFPSLAVPGRSPTAELLLKAEHHYVFQKD